MPFQISLPQFLLDKKDVRQVSWFLGVVLIVLVVWVVFNNFLEPEQPKINEDLTTLAAPISINLDTSSLSLINGKTYLDPLSLSKFTIYLANDEIDQDSNSLELRIFTPTSPLDLAYRSLVEDNLVD